MESPFKYQSLTRIREFDVSEGGAFHYGNERLVKFQKLDDEGFLMVQGLPPHSEVAMEETFKIAQLAYSILSKKRFYQEAHGRMLERLFNYCSKKLFRTRAKYPDFRSVLSLLAFSNRSWWVGNFGDAYAYFIRDMQSQRLLPAQIDPLEEMSFLGQIKRIKPNLTSGDFQSGDRFILLTKSVALALGERRILALLVEGRSGPVESLARDLISEAIDRRRQETYGAYVVERRII